MYILSLFTHFHVVPNLYESISSVEHKGLFLKNACNQKVVSSHSIEINKNLWLATFFKTPSFETQTFETQTGLEKLEGEYMTGFLFLGELSL